MANGYILISNLLEYKKFKNLGRNDKCGCESGKKYKKCCINFDWDKDVKNSDCEMHKNVLALSKNANKEVE